MTKPIPKWREWFVEINEWLDDNEEVQSGLAYSQTWLDEMEMTSHKMVHVIERAALTEAEAKVVDYNRMKQERDAARAECERLNHQLNHVMCAYCSYETRVPTPTQALLDHIEICEFHPIPKLKAKLTAAERALEDLLEWAWANHEMPDYSEVLLNAKDALTKIRGT